MENVNIFFLENTFPKLVIKELKSKVLKNLISVSELYLIFIYWLTNSKNQIVALIGYIALQLRNFAYDTTL